MKAVPLALARALAFVLFLHSRAWAAEAAPRFNDDASAKLVYASPAEGAERNVGVVDSGGRTLLKGVFVTPRGTSRPAPAILWVHWLGDPATSNHTEFLSDATALAEAGAASLLVDMPWSDPMWFEKGRTPKTDATEIVRDVSALRSAVGALGRTLNVDATRIAYVGHDFGAMDGALLLAADDRIAYAVLMAPTLSFWQWYLLGTPPDDRSAYLDRMSAFDLPRWLPRSHARATLLQFATGDAYVSRSDASVIRDGTPNRDRAFKRYPGGHALDAKIVHEDRRRWLLAHFELPVP